MGSRAATTAEVSLVVVGLWLADWHLSMMVVDALAVPSRGSCRAGRG